jgi:thiamine-phosphate pyrophosphorylase
MANRQQTPEPQQTAARFYLVTPPTADPAQLADRIRQAVSAGGVAAVLVPLVGTDERSLLNGLKALAPLIQDGGAAFLLDGRADLVARAGADGAHLTGTDQFKETGTSLKPARIAGCGGLASRHDAMTAAEAGADYVMFGEPDATGQQPPRDTVLERIAWWAEVFEVPCVGYAASLEEIGPLSAAGADFIAVGAFVFDDPRGPAAAMKEALDRLAVPEAVE